MSIIETIAVFGGIPVGVAIIMALLTLSTGRRSQRRYRPGLPLEFQPVWFLTEKYSDSNRSTVIQELPRGTGGDTSVRSETNDIKGGAHGNW